MPVYEDTAFIKNVIDSGYSVVFNPKAKVFHAHNYSIYSIFQRYFDSGGIYKKLGYLNTKNTKINSEGFLYLKQGIAFLINKKKFFWIPYFIMFLAFSFLGFSLGKYYNKLPNFLRKYFSKYNI